MDERDYDFGNWGRAMVEKALERRNLGVAGWIQVLQFVFIVVGGIFMAGVFYSKFTSLQSDVATVQSSVREGLEKANNRIDTILLNLSGHRRTDIQ